MKVKIITCSYNNADHLQEMIDSVRRQTSPNISFEVLDDCSSDNSVEILRDLNVPHILSHVNKGITKSYREMIDKAFTECFDYVFPIGADDVLEAECVEKLVRKASEGFDVVVSDLMRFGTVNEKWLQPQTFTLEDQFRENNFSPMPFFNKKFWECTGGYDLDAPQEYPADWLLGCKVAIMQIPFGVVFDPIYRWRQHDSQSSRNIKYSFEECKAYVLKNYVNKS